ncbi:MAG: cell filamentation protein Fic [Hyphomicrobium sp.]|nr:cell filamentation protein Fic [Hyphomicrobium sp.]PPC81463.1 MAG: cell filamentation protein Fic [Hyphomicrobium sp.]
MTSAPPKAGRIGTFVTSNFDGERVRAFLPPPLPPNPPLDLTAILSAVEMANRELGRLDGVATVLPSTNLFIWMYIRKEALLSSQIEGTQSSLSDLLLLENEVTPNVPIDDVREVSNYIAAMEQGLERLKSGFPLSLRLIREMHDILLSSGRGATKQPGEFRTSQNWIGGTRPGNALFVPPPPGHLAQCLGDLERFLHQRETYPVLIRAAMAHVQFETIHPFLDGNGRLGRLLITLMLCEDKALTQPTLYLSLYLKTHRQEYYDLLQRVRETGDWEAWMVFFLEGVASTSRQGFDTAQRLLSLFQQDEQKIAELGRASATALRLHTDFKRHPVLTVPNAAHRLGLSQPTIQSALGHLQRLAIVTEITGQRRDRVYSYSQYLSILDEGTEPLPPA